MRLLIGDCRDSMRQLIAEGMKVQMCVTSPPYWGLRDYGCAGQLGLEQSPQEYVQNMVEVFGLVRDLLEDDGTLWLNLGDSYAGGGNYRGINSENTLTSKQASNRGAKGLSQQLGALGKETGLEPKNLVGIPWRVAFALQADGWYLRQDIIWHKPNPMPESVQDRCTKAHEYLFLLAKSERYYFDQDAILEPVSAGTHARLMNSALAIMPTERNKRSVWTVPTHSYKEAHFATYPPALIEPCILAGSKAGDVVFDPFFGSGTTGEVAQRLGRDWLGCELNPEYGELAERRTSGTIGMAFA